MFKLLFIHTLLLSFLIGHIDKPLQMQISEHKFSSNIAQTKHDFQVVHEVKNNNVFIECLIPNFTFTNTKGMKKEGEGHLQVMIDGKQTGKFSTAAFIVKGLSKGEHTLTIRVVHNDLTYYPLSKTIKVVIK